MSESGEITIAALAREALGQLYYGDMSASFPPDELKPYEMMLNIDRKGMLVGRGCYIDGRLVAYAYFISVNNVMLLDYFAVLPAFRGTKIGSRFLEALFKEFAAADGVLLEVETPADSDPTSRENRRIAFYLRQGVRTTAVKSNFYGVDYTVLYRPLLKMAADRKIVSMLGHVYRAFLSSDQYDKNISLRVSRKKRF